MVTIDAGRHQRLNLLKDLMKHKVRVLYRFPPKILLDVWHLSITPLPVWPEGGKPCPFQRCGSFLCSARWGRTRCWGLLSPPRTVPPRAGPPSAQASHGTARGCCLNGKEQKVDEPDFTFCCETLFLRLPFSSTSCSWYFLRSATSFLYFSRRSLLASDISLMAAEICQTKKTDKTVSSADQFCLIKGRLHCAYLFFCIADSCPIKFGEVSNLAPQTGVVCLHGA